jgi:hypothetical protein
MKGDSGKLSLYFLIILICAFALIGLTADILWAQVSELLTLEDTVQIALDYYSGQLDACPLIPL